MKVKDLERTANVAWSPKDQTPILLAAGTAAQQLDASFSTNSALEIYSLNLSELDFDLKLEYAISNEERFYKLVWGPFSDSSNKGTILAGCEKGLLKIYSASKLLNGENGLVMQLDKHSGAVQAIDFNLFQKNLFATGAGDSEIFIWDLNNAKNPMAPGTKSQPSEDVLSLAWNRQVQHILASTFASKCVIWDLRKNEPIIKLTDTVSRVRWKNVAWHPEVATQLALASEEDHSPIIQIWDLRFATSALKTLESHQRGILSLAWCQDDPDLLVSCGKDNRILCWNPNSEQPNGEVLSEITKTNQWSFDVVWCPRNPALVACPNFDGHVSIYSVMGGKTQQIETTNKIADSFPGMDEFVQAPVPQHNSVLVSNDLSKPPKWLKRPVGASFGFGGKLITFENVKTADAHNENSQVPQSVNRSVQISQVITEPELVQKSVDLEQALEYGNFSEYCRNKADETNDQHRKYIWHFLKANFEDNPRAELLNLLGYKIEDINSKLEEIVGTDLREEVNGLGDQFSNLNRIEDFDLIANSQLNKPIKPFKIKTGDDTEGMITQALIMGNVEAAVQLCLNAKRFTDAIIIAMTGGSDLLARTRRKYLDQSEGYVSSLISALVSEDWASIINNCDISSWKEALAATLTHASDEDLPGLCEMLGNRLENDSNGNTKLIEDAQLCYICSGSFEKLVNSWSEDGINSTVQLQDLVELVTFLQKAVERQGRQVVVSGSLADLLANYASLLASQGNLQSALTYLGASTNDKVTSLRERLFVTLGQKSAYSQPARQGQSRRSSQRQSFGSYPAPAAVPFTPPVAPNAFANPPYGGNAPTSNPFSAPTFNTGLPNANQNQPWQSSIGGGNQAPFGQPVRAFSPPASNVLQSSQPPRPPSVSSSLPGATLNPGGLPSRKYVLDPSVSSNQYGFGSRSQPALTSQPMPSFQSNATPYSNLQSPYVPPTSASNVQTQYNSAPGVSPSMPPNPIFNPVPLMPAPIGTEMSNQFQPQPPIGQDVLESGHHTSDSGWNDPPVLNKLHTTQLKSEPQNQAPITHPLYGTAPYNSMPTNNGYDANSNPYQFNPGFNDQEPASQIFQPAPPQNSFAPSIGGGFNPSGFNQNALNSAGGGMRQAQPAQTQQIVKPEQVQKGPVPEEHRHVQDVFEELRNRCSCAANNPQTKRKLEDVGRKLEALYDLLRDYKLSSSTLTALHQMVQMIEDGNYTGGLNLHMQLVSGADFAQIASFMPGLKVLLQCALQLQVFLR